MTSSPEELRCYNATCGRTYFEKDNSDDACIYHPGHPVFHDAYKSWSCCSKKTTDFTEFLNFPGCTYGPHNNVKPEPTLKSPVKTDENQEKINSLIQEILNKPINLNDPIERPSEDSPLTTLTNTVSPNLLQQLEKLLKETTTQKDLTGLGEITEVKIGTTCKNNGCKKSYVGPESNSEECLFHPGTPIFHEGMKYWSCCRKQTTDFETFLAQEGCESGNHLWFKIKTKNSAEEKKQSCRFDWHQTNDNVIATIYSKLPLPDKCVIKVNKVKLSVNITYGGLDEKIFERDFILFSTIDNNHCSVELMPSKVEICMRKSDKSYWNRLTID